MNSLRRPDRSSHQQEKAGHGFCVKKRDYLDGLFCSFLFFLSLLPIAVLQAGYYLSAPAEPPRHADAIVLLGGDSGSRGVLGLALFKEGFADNIVLVRLEFEGNDPSRRYLHGQVREFLAAGIKKESIYFDNKSWHSWDEAANTLELMKQNNWKTVLVVSDPPHMRRLHWVWGRVFRDTGLHFILAASNPCWWHAEAWWRDTVSAHYVINEYKKIVYYRFRY